MKTLRLVLAALLAIPALVLTAGTAQAALVTVTASTSYAHTFFTAPNQVGLIAAGSDATVDLIPGGPSALGQLATLSATAGQNPGPVGHRDVRRVALRDAAAGAAVGAATLQFTYGVAVTWRCSHQVQLDITLPAGQSIAVGGGHTLTVTPYNYDPYAYLHPSVISVQWPDDCTLRPSLMFSLALTAPADSTPPQITPIVAGTAGTNGWFTSAAALTWSVADAESAISSRTGCVDRTVSTDQPPTTYACSATSAGGTAGPVSATIGVDLLDPTVTCPTSSFLLHQPGAVLTAGVSDTGSGPVATSVSAPADTSTVGSRSVTLTGRDNAGRTTSVQCRYSVGYGWTGFFAPVDPGLNTAKAGQAIPLKWRVTDSTGAPVTTLSTVSLTAATLACAAGTTGDQVEEYAAGRSGLQNLGDGYYQLNWKTPGSYAASCKTARLDLGDGVLHTADFAFRR